MTALLEYSDLDCSIRISRSFLANIVPKKWGAMAPLAPPSPPPMVRTAVCQKVSLGTMRRQVMKKIKALALAAIKTSYALLNG